MPGNTPLVSELFESIAKAETDDYKVFLLQNDDSFTVKTILQCAFSPNINFDLPETNPPYREDDSPEGLSVTSLHREVKKFVYFVPWHQSYVQSKTKREQIFIEMLEGLHDSEAKLVLNVKAKQIPGISHEVAHRAFPSVVAEPPAKVEVPVAEQAKPKPKKKNKKKE
jgi:hypothetical protein